MEKSTASGDDGSAAPDHMSIDDKKAPVPQKDPDSKSCSQCGARLGPMEYAEEMTEGMVSDQIWPHEDQLKELLEDLKKLMPEKDFKNVLRLVESNKYQNPNEKTSMSELLLYLKNIHMTPDKMRKTVSSSSSSSSSSTYRLYIVKVYPVVTGRTCGADEAILEQVKKVGNFSTTHVEITADWQGCDIIILFCPIASRVGIDVDAAMRKVPGDKNVILVVMHHMRQEDYSVDEKKTWSNSFNNVVLYVHVLFHETKRGLLKCKRNKEAVQQIRDELKKHSKNNYFKY